MPTTTAPGDPSDDEPNLTEEQRAAIARAISTPELRESIARFNGQFARIAQQITGNQFRPIAEQVNGTIGKAMAAHLAPALKSSRVQTNFGESLRPLIEAQLSTRKVVEPMLAQIAAQQQQWAKALAVPLISRQQFQSQFQNLVVSSEFTSAMRRVRELAEVELEVPNDDGFDRLAALVEWGDIDELQQWVRVLSVDAVVCTQKDLVKIVRESLGDRPLWAVEIGTHIVAGESILTNRLESILGLIN